MSAAQQGVSAPVLTRAQLIEWTQAVAQDVRDGHHDVRNLNAETAVSVHAYSPPLALMNYYDTEGNGLVKLASVWTDDPEEPAPHLVVAS